MPELAPIEINPRTFLREHCSLQPLPAVVTRIQEMIHNDAAEINDIAHLLSSDPALLAQIFKVVNSSYYGLPREISNVKYAITFLGLNEVYRLMLSIAVVNTLVIKDIDQLRRFWLHSYYAALCTKHIARQHDRLLSFEDLWSAAILHDIGKLVYLKFFSDHYAALMHTCTETGCMFSAAEAQHPDWPTSAYLGELLCGHWRLPQQIKTACARHSIDGLAALTEQSPENAFTRMIILGNLSAVLAGDPLNDSAKRSVADAIMTTLACSEEQFLTLMGEIYDLQIEAERFVRSFI